MSLSNIGYRFTDLYRSTCKPHITRSLILRETAEWINLHSGQRLVAKLSNGYEQFIYERMVPNE